LTKKGFLHVLARSSQYVQPTYLSWEVVRPVDGQNLVGSQGGDADDDADECRRLVNPPHGQSGGSHKEGESVELEGEGEGDGKYVPGAGRKPQSKSARLEMEMSELRSIQ
jgi:hypothetical protein